ncbi:tRNA (guanine-N(1)-)-methyltransferase [Purpureocillium lilacinum]|uniref:tRNA (guanine(9)-N1)-methyltransferase n=2 Tax=Purpureocillium lilacinum TaxID=33203 RepID=A0A179GPE3_PURLI|nr:tRNA (guanine-N(1)-)-methyltransferase [Purpureocillium lilacinum]OAQ79193.1 tRNA (guanine-N(1)-)-methyltransferase [Purpureocillium lilacinum]OAQ93048.1 tRNA (guanine-N(1)-)-methyltransferase [Purpureocillium lilacinum]GJN82581.1 tRNA (guanine(9)-N(1))-methyltransferase [Purpureocillium lilacinum]
MSSTEGVVDVPAQAAPSQPAPQPEGTSANTTTQTHPAPTNEAASTHDNAPSNTAAAGVSTGTEPAAPPPMSKNALKRLRRAQEWEDGKDDRRKRRKEKRQTRRERQREERAALVAQGVDPKSLAPPPRPPSALVPVALIVDCDFERYMTDKERVSLSSQVTRCYADNRAARYRSHLWLAGWGGAIERRFNDVLGRQQDHWKGVGFAPGDFLACAELAREKMRGGSGAQAAGEMIPALQRSVDEPVSWDVAEREPFPLPDPAPPLDERYRDVVYLTSESPYTLQRLEPHTSYVIGGLVDKNREKGLCYRRAREKGIRTARLPIGEFMVLKSRQILATNHVVEIMLKWLECEDWGEAFMAVIPKRKGGKLIGEEGEEGASELVEDEDAGDDDEEADDEAAGSAEAANTGEVTGEGGEDAKKETQ